MKEFVKIEDLKFIEHPSNKNVKIGYILTHKDDNVDFTSAIVKIPKGQSIPEHTHNVYDIICPLSGKGTIWVENAGECELKKGVFVKVPPHTKHKIYNVEEDLEIYDIFSSFNL
ncbi:cupin domain-containing protein [Desulfurella sp.]|uniref:cupin domain-containing protein n=1 Tax=Desulfurella sp. TaxID=1962857 RepID=UPI0025BE4921|nr:cupin domain-containing protein [Desulfurella sp.]